MNDLMQRLTSRKFLLAVAAAGVVIANKAFDMNLNETEVLAIVGTFITFIGVEGASDMRRR